MPHLLSRQRSADPGRRCAQLPRESALVGGALERAAPDRRLLRGRDAGSGLRLRRTRRARYGAGPDRGTRGLAARRDRSRDGGLGRELHGGLSRIAWSRHLRGLREAIPAARRAGRVDPPALHAVELGADGLALLRAQRHDRPLLRSDPVRGRDLLRSGATPGAPRADQRHGPGDRRALLLHPGPVRFSLLRSRALSDRPGGGRLVGGARADVAAHAAQLRRAMRFRAARLDRRGDPIAADLQPTLCERHEPRFVHRLEIAALHPADRRRRLRQSGGARPFREHIAPARPPRRHARERGRSAADGLRARERGDGPGGRVGGDRFGAGALRHHRPDDDGADQSLYARDDRALARDVRELAGGLGRLDGSGRISSDRDRLHEARRSGGAALSERAADELPSQGRGRGSPSTGGP